LRLYDHQISVFGLELTGAGKLLSDLPYNFLYCECFSFSDINANNLRAFCQVIPPVFLHGEKSIRSQ